MKKENLTTTTPEHIQRKFLPSAQSKSLAQLGFDEECLAYFENQNGMLLVHYNGLPLSEKETERPGLYRMATRNSTLPQWATASPLVTDAIDWFFDRFRLFSDIFADDDFTFGYCISRPASIGGRLDGRLDYPMVRGFATPLEARIACVDRLVGIVKERRHLDESVRPVSELMERMNLLNSDRPGKETTCIDELQSKMAREAISKSNQNKNK